MAAIRNWQANWYRTRIEWHVDCESPRMSRGDDIVGAGSKQEDTHVVAMDEKRKPTGRGWERPKQSNINSTDCQLSWLMRMGEGNWASNVRLID